MKKFLFIAFFAISALSVSGQVNRITKGDIMVGGDLDFSVSKFGDFDETKVTSFTIRPNIGYFFINNLAGGLRLSFNSTKLEEDDEGYSEFLGALFLRYYFLPATQRVNLFAEGSFGIGSAGYEDKESFNEFSFRAGPAFFLTPNVALEFALRYGSQGGDAYGNDERYNSFGLVGGFQIHLGGRGGSANR